MADQDDDIAAYYGAIQSASKGYRPDTSKLSRDQTNRVNELYNVTQQADLDRVRANQEAYAKLVAGPTSEDNTPAGGSTLIAIVLIFGLLGYFAWSVKNNKNEPGPTIDSYDQYNKLDEIDDPKAPPGKINVSYGVSIFPSNKASYVGKFKYGISQDSLRYFLAVAKSDQAPVKFSTWSHSKMIYLKNIPPHWITMLNGKKPVNNGWFMTFDLHNFNAVDTLVYRKIRAKNF